MGKAVVLTALGRSSFDRQQLRRLDAIGAEIVAVDRPLSDDDLAELVAPFGLVATTRRPKKHLHADLLDRLP